ncbi:MAG TPA: molybdopterin oxidoreductase [Anaerolineae bacterium]|nr:molybdopterin oxidoreductase [Anaerolineae bacterium]
MKDKSLTYAFWAVVGVATLVGLATLAVRVSQGLRVTNLTNIVPWGLWVAFYIYFIGLSAGSFLLSTLVYVFGVKRFEPIGRVAVFTALIALFGAFFFITIDLGHMERFWHVFSRPQIYSVLEIEVWFYVGYSLILLAELWLLVRQDLIRCGRAAGWRGSLCRLLALGSRDLSETSALRDIGIVRILGILGIFAAVGVHGGTGAIFAVAKARPLWYGPLLPIIFITSALVSGGALLTFIAALLLPRRDETHREMVVALGRLVIGLLVIDLLLLWSEFSITLYSGIPFEIAAFRLLLSGPFWWVFWVLQLGLGAVVPIILILWPRTGRSVAGVAVASLLIFVGIFGVRLNIVIPALSVPLFPELPTAYYGFQAPESGGLAALAPLLSGLVRIGLILLALALLAFLILLLRWVHRTTGRSPAWVAGTVTLAALVMAGLWFANFGAPLATVSTLYPSIGAEPINVLLTRPFRLSPFYFPSLNEWLTSVGLVGLLTLLFGLGWTILPLTGVEEVEEGEALIL